MSSYRSLFHKKSELLDSNQLRLYDNLLLACKTKDQYTKSSADFGVIAYDLCFRAYKLKHIIVVLGKHFGLLTDFCILWFFHPIRMLFSEFNKI